MELQLPARVTGLYADGLHAGRPPVARVQSVFEVAGSYWLAIDDLVYDALVPDAVLLASALRLPAAAAQRRRWVPVTAVVAMAHLVHCCQSFVTGPAAAPAAAAQHLSCRLVTGAADQVHGKHRTIVHAERAHPVFWVHPFLR